MTSFGARARARGGRRVAAKCGALLMLAMAQHAWAQGYSAILLPQLERSAQSLALGDAGAYFRGLNALGVNPAGLYIRRPEALAQYQTLSLDSQLARLGLAYPIKSLDATLAISYLSLRSAGFDKRNEFGDASGQFSFEDQMLGLHVGLPLNLDRIGFIPGSDSRLLSYDLNPLYVGASLKGLHSRIDSFSATAFAADFGARYAMTSLPLFLGISVRNFGRGPKFLEAESRLPMNILASVAYRPVEPLAILASVAHYPYEKKIESSVGLELRTGGALALRGRYGASQGGIDRSVGHSLAGGFGLKLYKDNLLDYAFQPFDSQLRASGVLGTHLITLTLRFGKKAEPQPRRKPIHQAGRQAADRPLDDYYRWLRAR